VCYKSGVWSNFGALHDIAVEKIREVTGKFPVLVNSGTAGISLALGYERDEKVVAIPDYTHAGSYVGSAKTGREICIISCNEKTMSMDLDAFEMVCRNGLAHCAVIVNPFGYGIDRESYNSIARRYGVSLVYDYAGAWGDFNHDDEFPTVYSFHATKSMPIGEGGVVLFREKEHADKARKLSNFSTNPDRTIANDRGDNLKLSEVSCAVLCSQLDGRNYQSVLNRIHNRQDLTRFYGMRLRARHRITASPSLCVFDFHEFDPAYFERKALESGFVAKQYYIPLSKMPAYRDVRRYGTKLRGILDRMIALPSDVSFDEAKKIVKAIDTF
jgi:dTDP-4-amino-4,6-dideoxygalactose transaminase